jgi:hypothetical protein
MQTLNITDDAMIKFLRIKASRPQDSSRAATFDHLLYVYEEAKFRPRPARDIMLEKQKLEREAKEV